VGERARSRHSLQAIGLEMAPAGGARCAWWAPTLTRVVETPPLRSTGGAAWRSSLPEATTRVASPWQAVQFVAMVGWVRSTNPLTWRARFTVLFV
jgi:hypothetical protein